VQDEKNQKILLDAFFSCLKKDNSLVFYYCKHTPLSNPNERVIVGVSKLRKDPGNILEYEYEKNNNGHRSYPWDRCLEHTLYGKKPDGFLLPYHDLLKCVEDNKLDIELSEYAAFAPVYEEFSYASELVEHDTAIDALLIIAESLKKIGNLLGKTYKKELDWIDNEISKIWDMRGAFPGIGAVLSSLKIKRGNTIAWEIEKYIMKKDGDLLQTDPWDIFVNCLQNPENYVSGDAINLFDNTARRIWRTVPSKKKEMLKLLSRIQLNNDQAFFIVQNYKEQIGNAEDIINNLYLLYEKTRFDKCGISFRQIDKALFPEEKLKNKFPIPKESETTDKLDEKRVRALCVWMLEEAANEGHSLIPFDDLLQKLEGKTLDEDFPINEDELRVQSETEFFKTEIEIVESESSTFVKLRRLIELRNIIRQRVIKKIITSKPYNIDKNWYDIVNSFKKFPKLDTNAFDYVEELRAREEKAEALRVMMNYSFSVLIGPAGSGKTSLLEIFESLPEIKGNLLKLAPTGKARVKLGHDAFTLAQFLIPNRYNGETGVYFINEEAERTSVKRNVIIDEASMLTEEQLAALFDALGPIDRLILVGDYRQLPPIGTGRPFVDIVNLLKPDKYDKSNIKVGSAYAELCQIRRQIKGKKEKRLDVYISRCFSDEPNKQDLDLFEDIASGKTKSDYLRLEKWYDSEDFRKIFSKVISEELGLDKSDNPIKEFNRQIGAKDYKGFQYFNYGVSELIIDNWQIITPVNGLAYGVKEVNKYIQNTYRKDFINLAYNLDSYGDPMNMRRKIAKPKGSDNIVYGDKVINLRNTKWYPKNQWIKPLYKKEEALNYIANGEIGVITGEFRSNNKNNKSEPSVDIAFSSQPGYSYVFWPKDLKDEGKYSIELAYAITVHKAQGSGFEKVFFVLPSKGAILSRELLYTALTRQVQKIIILHQGEFRDYIRYASTDASATARRFTDLFFLPEIKQIKQKYYDSRYINISEKGERMISKNEVIIANCLNKYKNKISYSYEDKLKLENEKRIITPDFIIDNLENGKRYYWEHLGMMTLKEYREKWNKKLKGYLKDGFIIHSEATENDDKILIITEENPNGGIDSQYFDNLVRKVILEENI
jgi:ATP-dependent exoDNAse (exonuclease V) alpha subunit